MVRHASVNPPSSAASTTSSSSLPTLEDLFRELQPAASGSNQPLSRDIDGGEGSEHGSSSNHNNNSDGNTIIDLCSNSDASTIIDVGGNSDMSTIIDWRSNSEASTIIDLHSNSDTSTIIDVSSISNVSTINNGSNFNDMSNIDAASSIGDLRSMANKDNMDTNNMDTNNMDTDWSTTPIPRLDLVAAAIFVPISESSKLLSPLDFAPNSPDHHRAALSLVTSHEASVRDNITALFQREILRISLDAEAANTHFDYPKATANVQAQHEAALRHDCEDMIANMRAPHDPSKDYNIKTIPVPNLAVPVTYVPINSPREYATQGVMNVVSAASRELASFDAHVASIRDAIEKQIGDSVLQGENPSDRMDVD
ncbi:hypothetical protein TARUN_446 [Trichoderma arundinaceum]|uniref:Uncharacterized protein n=1 Tax=Trichoderma arundinaceum TaxID=490622 RepID=A0A395P0A6_TRIAR|nr:hypothetical protein TARUN_446 [Trichoderma arundinaceum]